MKSASSTMEPPVEARLRERLGEPLPPDRRRKTRGELEWEALQTEAGPHSPWDGIRQEWRVDIMAKMPPPLTRSSWRSVGGSESRSAASGSVARSTRPHRTSYRAWKRTPRRTWTSTSRPRHALMIGWPQGGVAPEEIVRWRHACPGLWPETAIALANIGVSPRLAATRLRYSKIDPDAPTLWSRVQNREMNADDAKGCCRRPA